MEETTHTESTGIYRAEDLTVIKYRKRSLEMYPILDQELRELQAGYSSVHFGLCGAMFGAFVSLLITWLTVTLTDRMSMYFFSAVLVTGIAFAAFLCFAIRDYVTSRRIILQMKKATVDVAVATAPITRQS